MSMNKVCKNCRAHHHNIEIEFCTRKCKNAFRRRESRDSRIELRRQEKFDEVLIMSGFGGGVEWDFKD